MGWRWRRWHGIGSSDQRLSVSLQGVEAKGLGEMNTIVTRLFKDSLNRDLQQSTSRDRADGTVNHTSSSYS